VLAARGYPDSPELGAEIVLPKELPSGVTTFHAGTARGADGVLRVAGGRVLTVTAVAPKFSEAQRRSREAAADIRFEGKIFRSDIGWREESRQSVPSAATAG
jgi:phosphoribosylamine--glycine ligase